MTSKKAPTKTLMQVAQEWERADMLETAAWNAANKAETAFRAALENKLGPEAAKCDLYLVYAILTLK